MKIFEKVTLYLGALTVMLFLTIQQSSAALLVLNRVHNYLNVPVKIKIYNRYHRQVFVLNVGAKENKTFPWASIWLVDDPNPTKSLGNKGVLELIRGDSVITEKYNTHLVAASFYYEITFGDQAEFTAGMYPMQGKAWTHLDIYRPGAPVLYAGG